MSIKKSSQSLSKFAFFQNQIVQNFSAVDLKKLDINILSKFRKV